MLTTLLVVSSEINSPIFASIFIKMVVTVKTADDGQPFLYFCYIMTEWLTYNN